MIKKLIFKIVLLCLVTAVPNYGRQNTGFFPFEQRGNGINPQLESVNGNYGGGQYPIDFTPYQEKAGGILQQGPQFVKLVANNAFGQVFRSEQIPTVQPVSPTIKPTARPKISIHIVDEKSIFRQKRNTEVMIPKTEEKLEPESEIERVELDNRFLGGIGKKIIGQGVNALKQGVDVAGRIIQGGFHFPTNEPEYVPAHLRPPPNRPQRPINKPTVPSASNNQFGGSASNAQGQAQNVAGGFNQNAGSNTHSSNAQNELGSFQNTGGSSISANLANDGSSGQLGAANTQQSSQHTADGYKEQNAAQSQSTNFDNQGNLQLSNAGTNVNVIKEKDRERVETLGSSSSHNKNQFGTSNSAANTNTVQFNEGGVMGSQSTSQGQSTNIGADGSSSGSQTNAGTQQFTGPGGLQGTSSSSMSSSFNQGGSGNSGSSSGSSANSGTFGGQSFTGSGASASSAASTNTGSFGHPHGFQFSVAESKSYSASGSIPHGADISNIPFNLGFPLG